MLSVGMLTVIYAVRHAQGLYDFILSAIMMNAVMLSVMAPSFMLNILNDLFIVKRVITLSVILLNVV